MWTGAAMSSTVTGWAKCARIQETARRPAARRTSVANLSDPAAEGRAQQTNQNLVDHERSEEIRILRPRHQVEQARDRVNDVVGRTADIESAIVRRLGTPRG